MRELIRNILKEETEDLDKDILLFLKRRSNVKEIDLGNDVKKMKSIVFNLGDGEIYVITSFMSKKEMERKILMMLYEANIIDDNVLQTNEKNLVRQKIMRTIRHFLKTIYSDL